VKKRELRSSWRILYVCGVAFHRHTRYDAKDMNKNGLDRDARARFLQSEEGRIFVVGCCMLIIWIEGVAFLWGISSSKWFAMLTMGLTHLVAGRAAAIMHGTNLGLSKLSTVGLATYIDVTAMIILYPLLIFSYQNFFEARFFQKHMKPVFESARKGAGRMRRYKILGIFLFVWFPFWMTGIITGSVLGFLLGLRTWVTLVTVILGSVSAVICWVYAYEKIFSWLSQINQYVSVAISLVIIGGLIVLRLIRKRRESMRRPEQLSRQETVWPGSQPEQKK
jgi:uncharacterized membrane protein